MGCNKRVTRSSQLDNCFLDRFAVHLRDQGGRRGPLAEHSIRTFLYVKAVNRFVRWLKEEGEEVNAEARKLPRLPKKLGDATAQFVNKITSYAGFSTSGGSGGVRGRQFNFEHEVYFEYFLSRTLRDAIASVGRLDQLLRRGILPQEAIDYAMDGDFARDALVLLPSISAGGIREDNRRRNSGTLLAMAALRLKSVVGLRVRAADFVSIQFGDAEWSEVDFHDCIFENAALQVAQLVGCTFRDCRVDGLLVSRRTRLECVGLTPGAVVTSLYDYDRQMSLHSPREIHELLLALGASLPALEPEVRYSRRARAAITLLEKLVRRYRRTNIVCLQDDTLRSVLDDPAWDTLHRLILEYGIVTEEQRRTAGRPKTFMRPKVGMTDILRWETVRQLPNDVVGEFWAELRRS